MCDENNVCNTYKRSYSEVQSMLNTMREFENEPEFYFIVNSCDDDVCFENLIKEGANLSENARCVLIDYYEKCADICALYTDRTSSVITFRMAVITWSVSCVAFLANVFSVDKTIGACLWIKIIIVTTIAVSMAVVSFFLLLTAIKGRKQDKLTKKYIECKRKALAYKITGK